jgi:hypothetical protein
VSMRIETPILDILKACTVADGVLYLPPQQLERKTYEAVNKVLTALGGRWNRKAKGHTFDLDPSDELAQAIASGQVTAWKQAAQFFETPEPVVRELISQADFQNQDDLLLLEPSAGRGAIASAIREAMEPTCRLHLLEKEEKNLAVLRERFSAHSDTEILAGDFLQHPPLRVYDRIIANPPFTKRADAIHVLHMWECLKPGGILVSVMSAGLGFRQEKEYERLRVLAFETGHWEYLPAGSFKASGTEVSTGIIRLEKSEDEWEVAQ